MKYLKIINIIIFLIFFLNKNAISQMRISGLDNLESISWDGGSDDVTLEDDICVYSNESSGNYEIRAIGSGPGGSFRADHIGGSNIDYMNYSVFWNDVSGTSIGQIELTKNNWSETQTTVETSDENCANSSGASARIQIVFANSELSTSYYGSYNSTLTLQIRPI